MIFLPEDSDDDEDSDFMGDCCDVCFKDQGAATMYFCCGLEMCISCWGEHRRRFHEPEPEVNSDDDSDDDSDGDEMVTCCDVCFRDQGGVPPIYFCCGLDMCHQCWIQHQRVSHDPEPEVQG